MPYKHQINCYRTFDGVKYFNQCDVLEELDFCLVEKAKKSKLRHRLVKHKDGFVQLFVHSDDVDNLYNDTLIARRVTDFETK
jgi:hypothetical protein